MSLVFRVRQLRFGLLAEERIFVPPGKGGNLIRGALGVALRQVCCPPECRGPEPCETDPPCGYRRIFAPKLGEGPSGLADPPRPFVLRAREEEGGWLDKGTRLEIPVHLFDFDPRTVDALSAAFTCLAAMGIGPARGRCRRLPLEPVRDHEVPLEPAEVRCGRLEVNFLTPAEFKVDGRIVQQPEFTVLAANIRNRVASLMTLYQGRPALPDFKGFLDEASSVRLVSARLESRRTVRRSTRTGQSHPLGGNTGCLVYEGPIGRYLPWLRAAEWTGVGRQTVWGKGQVRICPK